MKFLIVTQVMHYHDGERVGSYEPYVREINLWIKHVELAEIVAPVINKWPNSGNLAYDYKDLKIIHVPTFNLTTPLNVIKTCFVLPIIMFRIIVGMCWADHIHLRCPGNMGLLGCCLQVFFPHKRKTAKYAGNWDASSTQPWSYRLQRFLLANSLLTRNMQVLVYGTWPNQTRNIRPFFTASYHAAEIVPIKSRPLTGEIKLVFLGGLTPGKRPLLSVQVLQALIERGVNATLEILGEGVEREKLVAYISEHHLSDHVHLLGNVDASTVKSTLQDAHFLIFLSRSEGWPKAVAESMFWGCVPITSRVSCVPYMLGDGSRGTLIEPSVEAAAGAIEGYLRDPEVYLQHANAAAEWSRQFTLEKFEEEIVKLLHNEHESLSSDG